MASRDGAMAEESDSSVVKDEPCQDEGKTGAGGCSSERHEETTTTMESIRGLDEVHMALNSLDDHTQAGLQTLRTAVTQLSREQTTYVRRIATLEEQLAQAVAQQEVYQSACSEAQQEIQTVTEQKDNVLEDNKFLHKQMEKLKHDYEVHLEMIAGRHRSRLLACRALRHWRNKAKQGGQNVKVRIQLLEEENQGLREELLQYQEATKQAFLRSANVLNAEALAVFQDAATRRLGDGGYDGDDDDTGDGGGGKRKDWNGVTVSSLERGRGKDEEGMKPDRSGDNKENEQAGAPTGYQGESGWTRTSPRSFEGGEGGGGLARGTSRESPDTAQPGVALSSATGPTFSGAGAASKEQQPPLAQYYPNSLRDETRARLQQLKDDQLRSARGVAGHRVDVGYEPSAKSLRTTSGVGGRVGWGAGTQDELGMLSSGKSEGTGRDRGNGWRGDKDIGDQWREQVGFHTCHCSGLPPKASSSVSKPMYSRKFYDCPYCSPISDSSYGHARPQKVTRKVSAKTSNTTRNAMLSSAAREQGERRREVLYKPSSTVIIEKHIGRYK